MATGLTAAYAKLMLRPPEPELTFEQRVIVEQFQESRRQANIKLVSLIMLSALVIVGVVFLIVATLSSYEVYGRRTSCIVATAALVYPGPGDTGATAFVNGQITFDLTLHTIKWNFNYDNIGVVTEMDIIGPVDPTNPLDGPVFLAICGTPSTAIACLTPEPNLLEQTISETSPIGQPLNSYIVDITQERSKYLLRIKTQNFPAGALAARLNTAC